ncbi:hypothetical protein HMI55_005525 [Coelomomyces lativittatus]|nr:hypothetical protein HMI55_005525 [Coelomomyces lativittatus]KAJ1499174.1 hypothetical protein HMI56_004540 [Coelomomyces lativittatus]
MVFTSNSSATPVWSFLIVVVTLSVLLYFYLPSHPDRNIHVTMSILSIVTIYMLWAVVYMAQMYPLLELQVHKHTSSSS